MRDWVSGIFRQVDILQTSTNPDYLLNIHEWWSGATLPKLSQPWHTTTGQGRWRDRVHLATVTRSCIFPAYSLHIPCIFPAYSLHAATAVLMEVLMMHPTSGGKPQEWAARPAQPSLRWCSQGDGWCIASLHCIADILWLSITYEPFLSPFMLLPFWSKSQFV